jgi:hypothetical protein
MNIGAEKRPSKNGLFIYDQIHRRPMRWNQFSGILTAENPEFANVTGFQNE